MSEKNNKQSIWDKIPFIQKIKNIKHIEIIIVSIFAIILGLICISSTNNKKSTNTKTDTFSSEAYTEYLENKLSSILKGVNGVGEVNVMLTVDGGMTYEYAKESEEITTSSELSSGTTSKTTVTEEIILVNIDGKSTPLVLKANYPKICGVLIVATGANNAQVKLNITKAIVTTLDVEEDKIQILAGNK